MSPEHTFDRRQSDFRAILESVSADMQYSSEEAAVVQGDSLKIIKQLPDNSVSLILTDPPYHSTKKANITGDRDFKEDSDFIAWMREYTTEWKRILKASGTLYLFCASEMAARLEVMGSELLRPINHIVWTKPNEPGFDGWKGKMKKASLRRWYPHSERILMFEHGTYGSHEAYRRSPVGQYLLDARKATGMTMTALTEATGSYGKVNRGGAVANWEAGRNIPSRQQYERLTHALESTGKIGTMLAYEDLIRPMNLAESSEFTDVWNFMSVRPFRGKHPAEKPQELLMHAIQASSYPNDVVLDCFAGSGSTLTAARRLGRKSIGIELEPIWVDRIINDLRFTDWERQRTITGMSGESISELTPSSTGTLFD